MQTIVPSATEYVTRPYPQSDTQKPHTQHPKQGEDNTGIHSDSKWWNQSVQTYATDVFKNDHIKPLFPAAKISHNHLPRSTPTVESFKRDSQGDVSRRPRRLSTKEAYEKALAAGKVFASPVSPNSQPIEESHGKRGGRHHRHHRNEHDKHDRNGHSSRLAANSPYGGCLFALKSTSIHSMVELAIRRPHHPLTYAPLMLPNPCLISVTTQDTISRVFQIMLDNNVRAVAVFGAETMIEPDVNEYIERFIFRGIISVIDLLAALCKNLQVLSVPMEGSSASPLPGSVTSSAVGFTECTVGDILEDIISAQTVEQSQLGELLRRGTSTLGPITQKAESLENQVKLKCRLSDSDDSVLELIDRFEKRGKHTTAGHWTCVKEQRPVSRLRVPSSVSNKSLNATPTCSGPSSRRSSFQASGLSVSRMTTSSPQQILPASSKSSFHDPWNLGSSQRSQSRPSSFVWTAQTDSISVTTPSEASDWSASSVENNNYLAKFGTNIAETPDASELLRMTSLSDIIWFAYSNRSRFPEVFNTSCQEVMTWIVQKERPTFGIKEKGLCDAGVYSQLSVTTITDDEDEQIDFPSLAVPAVYEDTPTWAAFQYLHSWASVSAIAVVNRNSLALVEHLCVSDVRFLDVPDSEISSVRQSILDSDRLKSKSRRNSQNFPRIRRMSGNETQIFGFEENGNGEGDDKIKSAIDVLQMTKVQEPDSEDELSFSQLLQLPVGVFIDHVRGTCRLDSKSKSTSPPDGDIDSRRFLTKHRSFASISVRSELSRLSLEPSISSASLYSPLHPEPLFTIKPTGLLEEVAGMMMGHGVRRAWVIDETLQPVGMVEISDVVATLVKPVRNFDHIPTYLSATSGRLGGNHSSEDFDSDATGLSGNSSDAPGRSKTKPE